MLITNFLPIDSVKIFDINCYLVFCAAKIKCKFLKNNNRHASCIFSPK